MALSVLHSAVKKLLTHSLTHSDATHSIDEIKHVPHNYVSSRLLAGRGVTVERQAGNLRVNEMHGLQLRVKRDPRKRLAQYRDLPDLSLLGLHRVLN